MPEPGQITFLLKRLTTGDHDAESQLMDLIYDHMRRTAGIRLLGERRDISLQPSDMVSDLFIRLFRQASIDWQDRRHLFAIVAATIRRILLDHARKYARGRRPPPKLRVSFDDVFIFTEDKVHLLLQIDQVIDLLGQEDPREAKIFEMRYFGGFSENEIAAAVGISERTVRNDLKHARAWLQVRLNSEAADNSGGA